MASSRHMHGWSAVWLVNFGNLAIFALSITLICLNKYWLYPATTYQFCAHVPLGFSQPNCPADNVCFWNTDPINGSTSPCQYLYAVGSLGIVFSVFTTAVSCLVIPVAVFAMAGLSVINMFWFLAAAIYFNNQVHVINALWYSNYFPEFNHRLNVQGMLWAMFLILFFQVCTIFVSLRRLVPGSGDYVEEQDRKEEQQQANAA